MSAGGGGGGDGSSPPLYSASLPPTALGQLFGAGSAVPLRFPSHSRHSSLTAPFVAGPGGSRPSPGGFHERKGSGGAVSAQTKFAMTTSVAGGHSSTSASANSSGSPSPRNLAADHSRRVIPAPVGIGSTLHPSHSRHGSGSSSAGSFGFAIPPPVTFPLPFSPLPPPPSPLPNAYGSDRAPTPNAGNSSPETLAHRSVNINTRNRGNYDNDDDDDARLSSGSASFRDRERMPRRIRDRARRLSQRALSFDALGGVTWFRQLFPSSSRKDHAREKEHEKRLGMEANVMRIWRLLAGVALLLFLGALFFVVLPALKSYCASSEGFQTMTCRTLGPFVGSARSGKSGGGGVSVNNNGLHDSSDFSSSSWSSHAASNGGGASDPGAGAAGKVGSALAATSAAPVTLVAVLPGVPSTPAELQHAKDYMDKDAYEELMHTSSLQWAALASWTRVVHPSNLLLFMNTEQDCTTLRSARPGLEAAQCVAIPCWGSPSGGNQGAAGVKQPLLDCVVHMAHARARTDLIAFVIGGSTTIMDPSLGALVQSSVELLRKGRGLNDPFVLVSRRTDSAVPSSLLSEWAEQSYPQPPSSLLAQLVSWSDRGGALHSGQAVDLLVFPKSALGMLRFEPTQRASCEEFKNIYPRSYDLASASDTDALAAVADPSLRFPPFLLAAGAPRWANWVLSEWLLRGPSAARVVDLTRFNLVLHTSVTSTAKAGAERRPADSSELATVSRWNDAIIHRLSGAHYKLGRVENANFMLEGDAPSGTLVANEGAAIELLLLKRSTAFASGATLVDSSSSSSSSSTGALVLGPTEDEGAASLDGSLGRPIGGWVALVSASSRDETLVENWLCWASRNGFEHFVFLAQDRKIARVLALHGVAYVLAEGAPEVVTSPSESLAFIQWRLRFLRHTVRTLHVVSSSVRSVWLRGGSAQLFHHFSYGPRDSLRSTDVFSRAHDAFIPGVAPGTGGSGYWLGNDLDKLDAEAAAMPKLDSRVLAVKATKGAHQLLKQVEQCVEQASDKLRASTQLSEDAKAAALLHAGTDLLDRCLTDKMKSLRDRVRWGLLDPLAFPTAATYFDAKAPQAHGILPWIVDLSALANPLASWHQLADWGLLATSIQRGLTMHSEAAGASAAEHTPDAQGASVPSIGESTSTGEQPHCIPIASPAFTAPQRLQNEQASHLRSASADSSTTRSGPAQDVFLSVRILAFNRADMLTQLLSSLLGASYPAGEKVSLVIAVDRPSREQMEEPQLVSDWQAVVAACQGFTWPHGPVQCLVHEEHQGLVGQWTGWSYPPAAADEAGLSSRAPLVLVLEDDVTLSPLWYSWTVQAVRRYYLDPSQFDPRLFGLSLQNQHTVLGESIGRGYSAARAPFAQLSSAKGAASDSPHLYRYQLVGAWGALFFPQHWREFQDWLREKRVDRATGTSRLRAHEEPGLHDGDEEEQHEQAEANAGASSSRAQAAASSPSGVERFRPCVPLVIGNAWWSASPSKVWSQWFVRFAFERGYYSLYTNFPEQMALATNQRASGLHFTKTRGSSNPLLDANAPKATQQLLTSFPPLQSLPVFDFHFRRLHTTSASAPGSTNWLALAPLLQGPPPPHGVDACLTLKQTRESDAALLPKHIRDKINGAAGGAAAQAQPQAQAQASPSSVSARITALSEASAAARRLDSEATKDRSEPLQVVDDLSRPAKRRR